jgi:hypothetical protein
METQSAQLMYSRGLGRSFTAQVAAGPEIIHTHGLDVPNRLTGSGLASIGYARKVNRLELRYSRGANGGSGLLQGELSDSVQLSAGRQYRVWSVTANGSYVRNRGIVRQVRSSYDSAGLELTRSIDRIFGTYFSYTYMKQAAGDLCFAGTCALNGDEQVFGFGFNWQPRGWRVGH